MADVFISYARLDRGFVQALAKRLELMAVPVWYDASIQGGAEWRASIVEAIEKSRLVVLVYSRATEKSVEVAKELAVAASARRWIVPVRIEDLRPSGAFLYEMARLSWVDAFPADEARVEAIALALAGLVRSGAKPEAIDSFNRSVGARSPRRGALARLSRSSFALALALCGISVALFAAYDQATSFMREQEQAGMPALDTFRSGALAVTLGAPLLLVQSFRHLDRPWTWAVMPLAAANCGVFLLAARNAIGWARRRIAMAWAARRSP